MKTTQIYCFVVLEIRSPKRVSKDVFLLETLGENPSLAFSKFHRLPAFLGQWLSASIWPLFPSSHHFFWLWSLLPPSCSHHTTSAHLDNPGYSFPTSRPFVTSAKSLLPCKVTYSQLPVEVGISGGGVLFSPSQSLTILNMSIFCVISTILATSNTLNHKTLWERHYSLYLKVMTLRHREVK